MNFLFHINKQQELKNKKKITESSDLEFIQEGNEIKTRFTSSFSKIGIRYNYDIKGYFIKGRKILEGPILPINFSSVTELNPTVKNSKFKDPDSSKTRKQSDYYYAVKE